MVIKRQKLDETSIMPWGEHSGLPLWEVPPSYLLWLLRQPWIKQWPDLYEYLVADQDNLIAEVDEVDDDEGTGDFKSMEDYLRYGRN